MLEVSEAALYRHFASKAQMFEGLIEFIEQSLFTLNQAFERLESLLRQSYKVRAEARGSATPTVDGQVNGSLAISVVLGRLHRFTRTGFKRLLTEHLDAVIRQLLA